MGGVKYEIQDYGVTYGGKTAIRRLDLTIYKNQILSVIGPANSGVTTLLRSLNRMTELSPEAAHTGRIWMDGQEIHAPRVNIHELRRKVGMVFDVPTALPLSIFDNIAYGPRVSGVKNRGELAAIVENALTEAALWEETRDRLKDPAMSLSGGQQQRLCMARALALSPEVILLDRPCSGLDPISTAKIEESLMQLKERLTVILAPHSIQQGARIADRSAFMLSGDLIEEGPALFDDPQDQRTNDYITGRFG